MFRVFQEEKLITICMFAFLGSSILLRVFLGLLYRNMIKEADNMASTKNRLLKQCKTKFASCYQLGNGVANIPVFVDKFLNRMSLGHLSFETIYHLSGQMMLLSVVCSGIGVCKSIIGGRTVGEVLPFYIVSFFGLYAYFSISTVVDVRGKKRVLKINLVDYLENHLSPRIEVTRQDLEMLYGESAFEEKRQPYGRIQGGRAGRGKGRKGIQAKPEKRRTVELMPIDNRMAAGGEDFQEEVSAGQPYMTVQQGQQVQKDAGQQGMPQAQWGAEDAGALRAGLAAQAAEPQKRTEQTAEGGTQEEQMLWAEAAPQTARTGGEGQGRTPQHVQQPKEGQEQDAGPQWAAGQGDFQMAGPLLSPGFQAQSGSPEDSAAVTEEELEALLKEFLTT